MLTTKKGLLSSTEPFCFNKALVRGGFEKTCFGAIGPKAVTIGPNANHQEGASVLDRTMLPEKALVKGSFKQACVGAIGPKAVTTCPNANHPKGASVFNRTLLLKKA